MNFQIKKIVVWPRDRSWGDPQEVEFALDKVNVITGDSRTGKSAIIPIIDYCLGSRDCLIPVDVIRDSASWYGVVIATDGTNGTDGTDGTDGTNGTHETNGTGREGTAWQYTLIARQAPPDDGKVSNKFVLRENIDPNDIPDWLDVESDTDDNLDDVKDRLNAMARLPYVKRDDGGKETQRVSFRDVLKLVLQSQDVVASQSVFFYRLNEGKYHTRLSSWFRFLIGAEPLDRILKEQLLDEKEHILAAKEKSLRAMDAVCNERLEHLKGLINAAAEFGFCELNAGMPNTRDELLKIAQQVVAGNHTRPQSTVPSLTAAGDTFEQLMREDGQLATDIAKKQREVSNLRALKTELTTETNLIAAERRDRLQIISWFDENRQNPDGTCPFCGSETAHDAARTELFALYGRLNAYAKQAGRATPLPRVYELEEKKLGKELQTLLDKRAALNERFDAVRRLEDEDKNLRYHNEQVFKLIGLLEAEISYHQKIEDPNGLRAEVEKLKAEILELDAYLKAHDVHKSGQTILKKIGELAQARMDSLDCDVQYKRQPPILDVKTMNITTKDDKGRTRKLNEIGSASNWVSFHLAYECALQEYFGREVDEDASYLPSFALFDQPSQVYFPHMEAGDVATLGDGDKEHVKDMFRTLVNSVASMTGGKKWQPIVLEHADASIYQEFLTSQQLEEPCVWRGGEALIPRRWLERNEE